MLMPMTTTAWMNADVRADVADVTVVIEVLMLMSKSILIPILENPMNISIDMASMLMSTLICVSGSVLGADVEVDAVVDLEVGGDVDLGESMLVLMFEDDAGVVVDIVIQWCCCTFRW